VKFFTEFCTYFGATMNICFIYDYFGINFISSNMEVSRDDTLPKLNFVLRFRMTYFCIADPTVDNSEVILKITILYF